MIKHRTAAHILDALVIGGGTSGLTAAFYLNQQGIAPVVLEARDQVATSWRERHPQLALNTHRLLSSLPGKSLSLRHGGFVKRDHYARYLERYSDWLQQEQDIDIQFNTRVQRVRRTTDAWQVDTNNGTWLAQNLVIATGADRIPYTPQWPGLSGYLNEHKHAADFGSVAQYRDRRVLIVGAGNSAMDIANHLVRSGQCKSISISTRSGGHILPTRFLGFPLQLMTPLLVRLPLKMQDRLVSLISTFCLGDLTKWNFNSPLEGVCSRLARQGLTPGFDEGCVAAIKSGEIKILPGIEQFNQQDVQFTNGETQAFDNVIFATGYRSGLESLLKPFDAVDSEGRPLVHAPEADASNPGLWLFGMQNKVEGNFLARQKEARKMARQIRKDQSSPRLEPAIQH